MLSALRSVDASPNSSLLCKFLRRQESQGVRSSGPRNFKWGQITELVMCPKQEPFSFISSLHPQAGAGTAKESRSLGLRKSEQLRT